MFKINTTRLKMIFLILKNQNLIMYNLNKIDNIDLFKESNQKYRKEREMLVMTFLVFKVNNKKQMLKD